jgi:hypothetical protein
MSSPRSSEAAAAAAASVLGGEKAGASRKRGRAERGDTPLDITNLSKFIKEEEGVLRANAKAILNETLITRAEAAARLEERLDDISSYQEALDCGFVAELRQELMRSYRMGVKLETWCNSYTPPLASGGNAGVSGEVQDGIYANIHGLTAGCSSALLSILAFEKEYAVQRTKCTDEAVWSRYKTTLEANMLHDVSKTTLQMHADLLNVANSITNNLQHLKTHDHTESKMLSAMY